MVILKHLNKLRMKSLNILRYYNTRRMYPSLGYISPVQFEELNSQNLLIFVSSFH
ncbi:IS3 family transposase [Anaerosolibacter sp.]|uniref:IS3 family transposase n=1 Tax=Anaerosolibacter sp. TaxID=1872527 RepID=UPI0039EEB43C